jgi:hypothetical protein
MMNPHALRPLLAILALLIAALGWYYLFYSRAAERLIAIEDQRSNRLRGILRRINAIVMLLIALGIAFGTYRFDRSGMEMQFVLTWSAVMLLLIVFVALAMVDLRLTIKLRQAMKERNK